MPEAHRADSPSDFVIRLSLARLASSLAHSVSTPLQVIAGRTSLAKDTLDAEARALHLNTALRKCHELSELLQRAVSHLRGSDAAIEAVEIMTLLESLVAAQPGSHLVVKSDVPKAWDGYLAREVFTNTLAGALAEAAKRASKQELEVSRIPETEFSPPLLCLECKWEGSPVHPDTSRMLKEPWGASEWRQEVWEDAVRFLAPYEAARQSGGSFALDTPNTWRLTWPVESKRNG